MRKRDLTADGASVHPSFKRTLLSKSIGAFIFSGISASLLASSAAFAQDATGNEATELEEVRVYGVRASQRSAIDRKKNAGTMSDSIVAEDIGDFPDKNIAEALARVTGIQLDREFGEGGGVSIRGIEPELTRVEINGISALGASDPFALEGRSNDFRSMASELVSALDVIKGSEARLTEGGIGGTIKITTRKPNDFKSNYLSLNAENQYNTLVDENNQKYNLIGVYKFTEDFGALLNITTSDKNTEFNAIRSTGYWQDTDLDGSPEKTFVNPNYADIGAVEDCDGNEVCERQWYDPRTHIPRTSIWAREEDRVSANGMVQFRFSDALSAHIGYTYNERDFTQDDYNYQLQDLLRTSYFTNEVFYSNHRLQSAETASSFSLFNRAVHNDWYQENSVIDAGFEFEHDKFTLTGIVGFSDEKQTIDQVDVQARGARIREMVLEWAPNGLPIITEENLNTGIDRTTPNDDCTLYDPAVASDCVNFFQDPITGTNTYNRVGWTDIDSASDEKVAQLDLVVPVEDSFITDFKAGVRYSKEHQDYADLRNPRTLLFNTGSSKDLGVAEAAALLEDNYIDTGEFFRDFDPGLETLDSWQTINVESYVEDWLAINEQIGKYGADDLATSKPRSFFDVDTTTTALYLQGDFQMAVGNMPLWGNVGVRYVQSDVDTTGSAVVTVYVDDPENPGVAIIDEDHPEAFSGIRTVSNDYSEVLPSLNLNLEVIPEELILFAGASKVMAHPKGRDLNIAADCRLRLDTESDTESTSTCTGGNPFLSPYVAKQYDLALSWYANEDTMLSAAYFQKKIDSYVLRGSQAPQPNVDYFGDGNRYEVRAPINGAGVNTKGYELSIVTFFNMLPAPFNNMGVNANFTHITSDDTGLFNALTEEPLDLLDLSEDSYNVSLFYDNDVWNAKLAYNYRDAYLVNASDGRGIRNVAANALYVDDAGFLDAKITYRMPGTNFRFYVDARNLTKEGRDYISGANAGIYERRYYGRDVSVGFTWTM